MPTIRDVATEAGVGVGTVSRVLNGSTRVAPATRQRVQKAMERLAYRPNPMAQGLRSRRGHTLEVLVPLFTRHFYVEVLRGIEMGLVGTDYGLLIRSIENHADRVQAFANAGRHNHPAGVLIVSIAPTADLVDRLQSAGCPVVLVDADYEGLPGVTVAHEDAAAMAVRHLLQLGHHRIALVDRAEDPFTTTYSGGRRAGYRKTLAEAGLELRPEYEIVGDFTPEAGTEALYTLLDLPEPPTAIFIGSDLQAIGVLQGARQRGCRVPEDLSVVGYNDIEVSQYLGLTTIRVPMREMGRRSVELLASILSHPEALPVQERLQAELVVRTTTAPPA